MPPPDSGTALPTGQGTDPAPTAPLAAAVRAAASSSQLEATLHDIVAAAVEHVDARYGAMGVLTQDGSRLDRFVVVGMDEDHAERIGRPPSGRGILRLLVEQPIALRLDDLTSHPGSTGFPPEHPPMRSFLGVPVRVRDAVFGNLYLTEKRSGDRFTAADVEVAEALAAVAGLAIEKARLAERAEAGRRWSQGSTQMATALLSGADPDEVLRSASTLVSGLTDADMAGVLSPSVDDDSTLTIVSAVGSGAADVEGVRVPLEGTHMGAARRAGQARLIDDISSIPVHGRLDAVSIELTRGFGSAMVVPLGAPPRSHLIAVLRRKGREPFQPEELDLLAAFAAQTSVCLELAHAHQREGRLQRQADRDRIARDLHDHVVQRIFATALSLDRLSRSLGTDDRPVESAQLARTVDELDETMAEIRAAIFELHQDDELSSVRRRLSEVVRQVTEGHDLRRDVRLRGGLDELPRDLVPDLLAVVRELVTNVIRHASARRVTVTVSAGNKVRVVVTDDGVGLPPVTVRSGLANLAERAERRGGRLTASSGPGGTEVRWVVPWTESR